MKFSEIEREQWDELHPYLDTCLLPITGLTGAESPAEATEALERLRDVLDTIEVPFKGRVVTYPALHYTYEFGRQQIEAVCGRLKREAGFRYVILAAAGPSPGPEAPSADLYVAPGEDGAPPDKGMVSAAVQSMWQRGAGDGPSDAKN